MFATKTQFCNQSMILRDPNNNNFITKFKKTLFFATNRSYCDGDIVASHDVARWWSRVVENKQS